jgi:Holliday junction DNA helicase RuvB
MTKDKDITTPKCIEDDKDFEVKLRPETLSDFIGQDKIKEKLQIFINAARERNDALDHVLFYGPPGLGKTTLAHIISKEMNVNINSTSGPVIERPVDLSAILSHLQERDILFLDEVHRLNHMVEEILYPAMEDFKLDILIGKGPGARSVKLELPQFTLVAATTRAGLLTSPLRARFGVVIRLNYYSEDKMKKIVERSASILGISIDQGGIAQIAKRSRFTPRVANRLLRRVRDYAQIKADNIITELTAVKALEMLEVDEYGLDDMDIFILKTIIEKFSGGPVGLNSLAVAVGEEKDTIEEVHEPYLIQQGFLERTSQGRKVTENTYKWLGIDKGKRGKQGSLDI